jgi:nucleoside-diphosphate-sugar epimerase
LTERILKDTDWNIQGFDLYSENMDAFLGNARVSFKQGDVFKEYEWLEDQVRKCDVVLPLAGIAKPAYYVRKPIWTFELDFEHNLAVVRMCSKYNARIIFPSTSELYGLSVDEELEEDKSPLVTGPIIKTRWIYSCSKQMMDRMIFAYGEERGLKFSIFRPFNWIGPRLDSFKDAEKRSARSVTQIIYDVLHRGTVSLVNGGGQKRSFTWVGDGIDALMAIIGNEGNKADGQIFNIGNPANNYSIKELALMLIEEMKKVPAFRERAASAELIDVDPVDYYGKTYDDMQNRIPSVRKINELLGWKPKTDMREALRCTVEWYAKENLSRIAPLEARTIRDMNNSVA